MKSQNMGEVFFLFHFHGHFGLNILCHFNGIFGHYIPPLPSWLNHVLNYSEQETLPRLNAFELSIFSQNIIVESLESFRFPTDDIIKSKLENWFLSKCQCYDAEEPMAHIGV